MNLKKLNIINIILYDKYIAYYSNNRNLLKINEGNIKTKDYVNKGNFFNVNKIIENIKKQIIQQKDDSENITVKIIIDYSFLKFFKSNNIQILLPKTKKIFISFLGEKNIKKNVIFLSGEYEFESVEVSNKLKNLNLIFSNLKILSLNLRNTFLTTCKLENIEVYILSIKNTYLKGNITNNKLKQLYINNSLLEKKIVLNIKKINELNIENSKLKIFNNFKNLNIKILTIQNLIKSKNNIINKLFIKNLEYLKLAENNLENIDIKLVNINRIIFVSNKFNNVNIKYDKNFKNTIEIEMDNLNIFNNINIDIKNFRKNVEILVKKILIKNKLTINNIKKMNDNKLSYLYVAHSKIETLCLKNFSIVRQINTFSKNLFLSSIELFYYEYKKFLIQNHKNIKNYNLYPLLKLYNVNKMVFSVDENISNLIQCFKNKILKKTILEIYFRNESYQKEIFNFIISIYKKNLKLKDIFVNVQFIEKNLELKFLNDNIISVNNLLYKNKIKKLLFKFFPYFYKLKIDIPDFIKNDKLYKTRKNKNDIKVLNI